MPITNQTIVNEYTANGLTTEYAYDYRVIDADQLSVYIDGVLQESGYTVSGEDEQGGGTITFSTAPVSGRIVRIVRESDVVRETDYINGGGVQARTLDNDQDYQTMLIQELSQSSLKKDASTGNWGGEGLRITHLDSPVSDTDAVTKGYLTSLLNSIEIAGDTGIILREDLANGADADKGFNLVAYTRTQAEIDADVTPTNYQYPPLNIRRYGGAPGAGDNTAAMEAAEAVCAAQSGGTIVLDTPGEWRMNWVCTTKNVTVQGTGGHADWDIACVRPYSLSSPTITIGDGNPELYYVQLRDLAISGSNDPGGVHYNDETYNAPYALKVYGIVHFVATNCTFYNGLITIGILPSATYPVSDIKFVNCKARNDLDGAGTRLIYGLRLADPGYFTDVEFIGCKFNSHSEYFAEFEGVGCAPIFISGYADVGANRGIYLKGGASIRSFAFDVDPGTAPTVIIKTDQAQADPTRYLFGYLTQGGQLMEFAGGAQILMPGEADWRLYRPRIFRAFMGATTYFSTANDPYNTSISLDLQSATGPLALTGSALHINSSIRSASDDPFIELYDSDGASDAKLWWARNNSGVLSFQTRADNSSAGKLGLAITRSGTAITQVDIGNSTDLPRTTIHGHLALTDGVAAPSATSGFAKLYVDGADGDLKVIFGDGTVKTIATDS